MNRYRFVSLGVLVTAAAAVVGCGGTDPGGASGAGGSQGSGGQPGGSGGTPASGGSTATASGGASGTGGLSGSGGNPTASGGAGTETGGTSSGGVPGRGTGGAMGGATGGRNASGGAGGVSATGGVGGITGTASGGSTGSGTVAPSAGCGKAGRPSGGMVSVQNKSLYMFPASYDGTKPMPLLIAFHACGNPNTEFVNLTKGSAFETNYVRSFPIATDLSGQCWTYSADINARIITQYDELMANYCIDKNRVFATGHSSGAQMIVQILTHKADADHLHFKAVAPVAASDYGALALPIPVMYIQGKMDSVRGNDGSATVARFRTANMCTTASMPDTQVMGCQSSGTTVNPGCITYSGCTVPTIWCSHNDPAYSGTSHGVPCFAIKAMSDFFAGLP